LWHWHRHRSGFRRFIVIGRRLEVHFGDGCQPIDVEGGPFRMIAAGVK